MRASRGNILYKKSLSLYLNSQSCLKAPGKTLNIAHSRFYLFNGSDEFFSSTIYDSTIRMDLDCFQPPGAFGFVPSESFGFPVLANSNFLLPDCFCASPICFLRFSNDSFSVASCFSASERNFINTNWKHQSGFFWRASLPILQNMIYSSLRSPAVSQTGRMKTGAFGWKHWKHAELVRQFKSVGG